jgi:hypothetical protein
MGWANCGEDSRGRPIGYAHPARCDEQGCEEKIDRGLAHACGGMHGTEDRKGDSCCEGYFCDKHLIAFALFGIFLCRRCARERCETLVEEATYFLSLGEKTNAFQFQELLGFGMRTLDLTAEDVAEDVETTRSTVEQWSKGAASPPGMKSFVATKLRARAKERLRAFTS